MIVVAAGARVLAVRPADVGGRERPRPAARELAEPMRLPRSAVLCRPTGPHGWMAGSLTAAFGMGPQERWLLRRADGWIVGALNRDVEVTDEDD